MKLIFKIAMLMVFALFVYSCQKQSNCPMNSKTENAGANQRTSVTQEVSDGAGGGTKSKDAYEIDNKDDVVGGGDDDRDGGEKKPKKNN